MIDIIIASTQYELVEHFHVRGQVFIIGQEIDWAIEFDEHDKVSVLFNAYLDGQIVGAARLYKNKVGRVATLEPYRKQGVATALMAFMEEYARNHDIPKLILHAQLHVKDFYLHLGYIPEGPIFQEADIDHVKMVKNL